MSLAATAIIRIGLHTMRLRPSTRHRDAGVPAPSTSSKPNSLMQALRRTGASGKAISAVRSSVANSRKPHMAASGGSVVRAMTG